MARSHLFKKFLIFFMAENSALYVNTESSLLIAFKLTTMVNYQHVTVRKLLFLLEITKPVKVLFIYLTSFCLFYQKI